MDDLINYTMVSYEGQDYGRIFLPFLEHSGHEELRFGGMVVLSNSKIVVEDIKKGTIKFFATNPPENPALSVYKFVPYKY